jgi:hypothetical protein
MVFPAELWVPDFTGVSAKSAGLWPKCGEWDIFEVYNGLGTLKKGTIHFENPNGSRSDAFVGS